MTKKRDDDDEDEEMAKVSAWVDYFSLACFRLSFRCARMLKMM